MGHWTPTGIEPTDYDDDEGWHTAAHYNTKEFKCFKQIL